MMDVCGDIYDPRLCMCLLYHECPLSKVPLVPAEGSPPKIKGIGVVLGRVCNDIIIIDY